MLTYIDTGSSITVVLNNAPRVISASNFNFTKVREALADPQTTEADITKLLDAAEGIKEFSSGCIRVDHGIVYYGDREVDGAIRPKILEFLRTNRPELADPLCKFIERVYENPSYRAVNGLFEWVSKSGMPITPEGKILAWKIVRQDYFDYHSGTLDHSPGKIVEIPRNQCDEDPDSTCSAGIHFCSYDYLPHYRNGDSNRRIMMVEIDPADVVAIPRDYNTAKGRCCRMKVVGEVPIDDVRKIFPDTHVAEAPEIKIESKQQNQLGPDQTWMTTDWDLIELDSAIVEDGTRIWSRCGNYQFDVETGEEVDGEVTLSHRVD